MYLLLSFFNFCMLEFFEFVCIVVQKRGIELEDNKHPDDCTKRQAS
jgi:hypothetical protein